MDDQPVTGSPIAGQVGDAKAAVTTFHVQPLEDIEEVTVQHASEKPNTDEQPSTSAAANSNEMKADSDMKRSAKGKAPAKMVNQEENASTSADVKLADHTDIHTSYRYDAVLWMFGILFLCILHSLMFGIGAARGWDALSPYYHNSSNSSMDRFLPEPWTPEPGVYKRSDKEASSRWYYWKLKPDDVTAWTKLFVWAGYSLHNLSVVVVLYLQQKSKNFPDSNGKYATKYTGMPDKYNLILFGLNSFFHLFHLLNTHVTYDGTAADTSEASSQSSVIVALIVMLFIEFRDRGVFFGYPSPNQLRNYHDSIWMSPVYIMRKYHGYFIYWAAIFTFWYHPMENTVGHAFGFTHTWFFMLQGSLAFTKVHLNKYWRFTMEVWVTIHSGVIAVQTVPNIMGKELWPMFVFGFATVIILTQLYGLPFWKNQPSWSRLIPIGMFIVIVITAYSFIRDKEGKRFTRITEIIRIPGIYYLILLVAWFAIVGIMKLQQIYEAKNVKNSIDSIRETDKMEPKTTSRPPMWKEIIILSGVCLTYVVSVLLSWILEYVDLKVNLIVLTMIYSFSFMFISAIGGSFILKVIMPLRRTPTP